MTPRIYALIIIAWFNFPALITLASGYHSMIATDPFANTMFIFSATWMLFGFYSALFYALIAYAYAYVHSPYIRNTTHTLYEQVKLQLNDVDTTPYQKYITPINTIFNTVETYATNLQVRKFLEQLDVVIQHMIDTGSKSSVYVRPALLMIKNYMTTLFGEAPTPVLNVTESETVTVTDSDVVNVTVTDPDGTVSTVPPANDDTNVPEEISEDLTIQSEDDGLTVPDLDMNRTTPDMDSRIIYSAS